MPPCAAGAAWAEGLRGRCRHCSAEGRRASAAGAQALQMPADLQARRDLQAWGGLQARARCRRGAAAGRQALRAPQALQPDGVAAVCGSPRQRARRGRALAFSRAAGAPSTCSNPGASSRRALRVCRCRARSQARCLLTLPACGKKLRSGTVSECRCPGLARCRAAGAVSARPTLVWRGSGNTGAASP